MTRFLVCALVALAFCASLVSAFSVCDAASSADEIALCQRCQILGRRGGCSSCEAMKGVCAWFYDARDPPSSSCGLASLKEQTIALSSGVTHAPEQCPADPRKAAPLTIIDREDTLYQEYFPKAYANEGSFCSFPVEPYFVDTFAHSYESTHFLVSYPESRFPRFCEITRKSFGIFPKTDGTSFFQEQRAFDKATLRTMISQNCGVVPPGKRDLEEAEALVHNPWASARGLECIRAMQSAYCSVACSEYGKAEGRLCPNRYKTYLYQVCAPWTAGPEVYRGQPIRNGCPLDPNNLPWDSKEDAFCDPDVFRLQGSGLFEETFGLYDPLEDAVARVQ